MTVIAFVWVLNHYLFCDTLLYAHWKIKSKKTYAISNVGIHVFSVVLEVLESASGFFHNFAISKSAHDGQKLTSQHCHNGFWKKWKINE